MPRTRAAHRLPSRAPTRHGSASATAGAGASPSASSAPSWRLIGGVAAGILALCAIGVGAGVHAALGDGDGPAIQLANRGVDLRPEADGGDADALGDGSAAGSPDDGAPPASDDPGAQAPRSTAPADPPASGVPTPGTPPSTRHGVPPTTPPTGATNPYLDPADPRYVPAAERAAWLEGEQRIRQCMADAGLVYLEWEWWQGGTPMPDGLDESAETAWMLALRGDEGSAGCAVEAGDAPKPPSGMERPGNTSPPPVPPPPSASPDEGAEQAPEQQLAPDAAEPEASAG